MSISTPALGYSPRDWDYISLCAQEEMASGSRAVELARDRLLYAADGLTPPSWEAYQSYMRIAQEEKRAKVQARPE